MYNLTLFYFDPVDSFFFLFCFFFCFVFYTLHSLFTGLRVLNEMKNYTGIIWSWRMAHWARRYAIFHCTCQHGGGLDAGAVVVEVVVEDDAVVVLLSVFSFLLANMNCSISSWCASNRSMQCKHAVFGNGSFIFTCKARMHDTLLLEQEIRDRPNNLQTLIEQKSDIDRTWNVTAQWPKFARRYMRKLDKWSREERKKCREWSDGRV